MNFAKISAAAITAVCLGVSSGHATTTLNAGLSSAYVLGEVIFNGDNSLVPSGGQETRDLTMVNQLVGIYNGTTSQALPYYLSANNFGAPPLASAVATGDVITSAGGISLAADGNVTITLGSGFKYLIAAYDGNNSGAIVWDISGIAAGTTLELPNNVLPNAGGTDLMSGDKYGMTTWSLFNSGTVTHNNVPDGGSTMALLGLAMFGIGSVRRVMNKK